MQLATIARCYLIKIRTRNHKDTMLRNNEMINQKVIELFTRLVKEGDLQTLAFNLEMYQDKKNFKEICQLLLKINAEHNVGTTKFNVIDGMITNRLILKLEADLIIENSNQKNKIV